MAISKAAMPDIETDDIRQRHRLIFAIMLPALAENLLSSLVSLADTAMVSVVGDAAISAVGLVTQPRFIVFSAFYALGTGASALIARSKGKGDRREACTALTQSVLMCLAISALMCLVMIFWSEGLIRFIAGANIAEDTIQMALTYFRIQIWGFPSLGLTAIINGALRGTGNTRAAFTSNAVANVVNVVLNYLLIAGNLGFPRMEVAGASLATVIGQCAGLVVSLSIVCRKKEFLYIRLGGPMKPNGPMLKRIWRIGFPSLIEQVIMRVGIMAFTIIVTSLGDDPYTAHIIAMNIQSLSFTTGMAFGTSSMTLTGQSLGRSRADLARWYTARSNALGYIVSFLVAALLFFGGTFLAGLFTQSLHIQMLAGGVLRIIALANPTSNARFVYNNALRGAGDARFTAVNTFVGILLIRPLVAALLVYVFPIGLTGVWIALISDAVICFFLARIRWQRGKWALIQV